MRTAVSRTLGAVIGVAVVGAAVVWLSGGFHERVPPGTVERPAPALPEGPRIAEVEQRSGPAFETASGAVASARQTVIAPRILARIEEIRVRAGDAVAEGDLLVRLDARDITARVAQAREAVQAARARRDLADSEKARYEQLLASGVATQQRLDQAVAESRAALADLDRLARALDEAETALSYTEIRAPVPGLVVDRLAEPGETVGPGTPILRVYDPAALRAEVPVRESLAVRLKVGDSLEVEIPALPARFTGQIQEIVPFAEPGARTLMVKVGLPQDPRLYAGLFARMAVPAGSLSRILVPEDGIERVGQLTFAEAINASGRTERRLVTLGEHREDGMIEVLSGLAPGERVVVAAPGTGG